MTNISYAQNGEDVVLARAFDDVRNGFYIDVGASDPVVDSVTKRFYDAGWSGINVEPAEDALAKLREQRSRDVNLGVALRSEPGRDTFYELPTEMTGCSTFSPELAEEYRDAGWEPREREIEVSTLQEVWEQYVGERTVDFVKIDVEGDERAVLEGVDFARLRPRVIVVEATRPGSAEPAHEGWEPLLTGHGYTMTLFDGLNRFYVRDEDRELVELLSVPANYFDDYLSARAERWRQAEARLPEAWADASAERRRAEQIEAALQDTRRHLSESQAALRDARTELSSARTALDVALAARKQ